jgi:hypothetical protein
MSDPAPRMSFLGGLVDRAFGLEPALQPRKASLFEPRAAAAAAVEPFGESTADEFSAPAAAPSYADTPPADYPAPRMPTALQAAIEIPLQAKPRAALIAEPVQHEIASRTEPAAPQPTTPALLPLALPQYVVTNTETFTHREEVSHGVDHVVERSVEHICEVIRAADDPPPRRARESRAEFIAEPVKPRREDPAPVTATLLARPVAQDLVAPRAETLSRQAPIATMLERPAPQGPVVNVTIGRVEVRAHSAPGRPSTDRRGAKPMSLDDYLKRRSGP